MDFSNNVILVFGAAGGVGTTILSMLKRLNAKVIGIYHKNKINVQCDSFKCDITSEDDVKRVFETIKLNYGHVDAVINCATYSNDDEFFNKTYEDFMKVVAINLGGAYLIMKYALCNMEKGTIINMSSLNASTTYTPLSMDYDASKAGIENLTKNFATISSNIKICALAPGWIDTEKVLEMEPKYLKKELERVGQISLIKRENVALKIIEILINNDDYITGEIIRMESDN